MDVTTPDRSTQMTQLTAINLAKILTVVLLFVYAFLFGIDGFRPVIYLCLHGSYCAWWLLEQWLFPIRRQQIFTEPVTAIEFILVLLFVGVFYSLPGYLAFTNPAPVSLLVVAIVLPLYLFGSLINAVADVQKLTAKQMGATLVKDNIWRFSRNINYFGDLLRYLSLSVLAGSPWAYSLPLLITVLYSQRIFQKDRDMSEKYADFEEYRRSSAYLIPFLW